MEIICEKGHFVSTTLSGEFPQIFQTVLYEVVSQPGTMRYEEIRRFTFLALKTELRKESHSLRDQ